MTSVMDLVNTAAGEMAGKLDAEIVAALNSVWGRWSMADVRRRCKLVRFPGSDVETLYADETPVLEIHPIEMDTTWRQSGASVRVTRSFRRLV